MLRDNLILQWGIAPKGGVLFWGALPFGRYGKFEERRRLCLGIIRLLRM
jgi:hypothetical protein